MTEGRSLDGELEATRKELARLTEQAKINSRILAESQARELSLLRAGNLQALFQVMLDGLRESYRLDAVTVVLRDPGHELRHLLLGASSSPAIPRGLFFVDDLERVSSAFSRLERVRLGA